MWRTDGELAPDIQPCGQVASGTGPVLVTGATGYLGRHLVRELLSEGTDPLYCLARSAETGNAAARVMQALQAAGETRGSATGRLQVVDGDISAPCLDLSPQRYSAIAREVSTIIHCAADVSWSRSYARLRSSNVLPVSHLLRLACSGHIKHFVLVSSLAVCYSSDPSLRTNESSDPSLYISRIPLGYAQSKAVAERLVREAVTRGLSATIFRPALIAGHTSGGPANAADFVSWLVHGCIRLGYAPDVDWRLDVVPVDFAAAAIARNLSPHDGLRVLHISHPDPRHWREFVLFLNLYGYPVRLEPFEQWVERLASFADEPLPLKCFLGFFNGRPRGTAGPTLSQIYEAGGAPRISSDESTTAFARQGLVVPRLDATYFARYLSSLADARLLSRPSRAAPSRSRAEPIEEAVLRQLQPVDDLLPVGCLRAMKAVPLETASSITTQIASWRHGGPIGLYRLIRQGTESAAPDLVLKVKASVNETVSAAIDVASACSAELGRLFARFSDHLEFCGAGERELAVYRSRIPRIVRHSPRCYAFGRELDSDRVMLLLEHLTDVELLDSVDRPHSWTDEHITVAIRDLAAIHAVCYGAVSANEISPALCLKRLDAREIIDMADMWISLYDYGKGFFADWGGNDLVARIHHLVSTISCWMPGYALHAMTVVHNDCNPRNIAFRRGGHGISTCLYDWELCAIAPPQRDLAELLCFVLSKESADNEVRRYVELHRAQLSRQLQAVIDEHDWLEGFRLALADLMLRRLSMYTMLHSYVRQNFLPRVVQSWQMLDQAVRP